MADHEGHVLGGGILGGDDQVCFVLAGGVVEDDEEFSGACGRVLGVSHSAELLVGAELEGEGGTYGRRLSRREWSRRATGLS